MEQVAGLVIDLTLPCTLHPGGLKAEVEAANTGEKASEIHVVLLEPQNGLQDEGEEEQGDDEAQGDLVPVDALHGSSFRKPDRFPLL